MFERTSTVEFARTNNSKDAVAKTAANRRALYCPQSGTRLAPSDGEAPATGTTLAVAVFDDGTTIPVIGELIIGRAPETHHEMLLGSATPVTIDDPEASLSRSHVLLRTTGWEIEVVDLGSRNGTRALTSSGWRKLIPGIGYRAGDQQLLLLGSRMFTIHHAVR